MRAVERQRPGAFAGREQADQPPGERVGVDRDALEEALRALGAGGGLGLAAEAGRPFGQVDAPHLRTGPAGTGPGSSASRPGRGSASAR